MRIIGTGSLVLLLLSLLSPAAAQDAERPICDITAFGATEASPDNAKAIQGAVEACQGKHGIVSVPAGRFTTGMVTLGSQMTLRIDPRGTLLGTSQIAAYPTLSPPTTNSQLLNCRRSLLYAEGVQDLTIEGGGTGTIDGNGGANNWGGNQIKEAQRPMVIFIVKSTGFRLENIQIRNGATWAVVTMETSAVRVSHVGIDTRLGVTHDGLDLVDGSDIAVDDLTVTAGDDAICLKSGSPSGLHGVRITNSKIQGSQIANGLKFGTASVGPVDNILVKGLTIEGVAKAALLVESVDGSRIQGVTFEDITIHRAGTPFFLLLGWRGNQAQPRVGSLTDITFRNVSADNVNETWGSAVSGTVVAGQTYRIERVIFDNVLVRFKGGLTRIPPTPPEYAGQYPDPNQLNPTAGGNLPAVGIYFRHVTGVLIQPSCRLSVNGFAHGEKDARPLLEHSLDASGSF